MPIDGLTLRRSVGSSGTRLAAILGGELVGYIEVESREDPVRVPRFGGGADIGNICVSEKHRHRRIGTWLVGQAAEWLHQARLDRLLDYALIDDEGYRLFLQALGFHELTRAKRGWRRASVWSNSGSDAA